MNIKELRAITQGKKLQQNRPWLYWLLQRRPSIYITRALLRTRATPNLITATSVASSLIGAALIAVSYVPLGIALLYAGVLLDKVDGELARARQQFSLRGIYLDYVGHLVVPPAFFIALGVASEALLPWGMLAAIASILIRAQWGIPAQIFAKKYTKAPEQYGTEAPAPHRPFLIARLFHQLQDFLTILIVALVATLAYPDALRWITAGYGLYLPLIFIENFIKSLYGINRTIQKFHI